MSSSSESDACYEGQNHVQIQQGDALCDKAADNMAKIFQEHEDHDSAQKIQYHETGKMSRDPGDDQQKQWLEGLHAAPFVTLADSYNNHDQMPTVPHYKQTKRRKAKCFALEKDPLAEPQIHVAPGQWQLVHYHRGCQEDFSTKFTVWTREEAGSRVCYVPFRGTITTKPGIDIQTLEMFGNIITDLDCYQAPLDPRIQRDGQSVKIWVHRGFQRAYLKIRTELLNVLRRLPKDITTIIFCGHSLGGALANLAATDWGCETGETKIWTIGAPHVGCENFANLCIGRVGGKDNIARRTNQNDIVPVILGPAHKVATCMVPYHHAGDAIHHGSVLETAATVAVNVADGEGVRLEALVEYHSLDFYFATIFQPAEDVVGHTIVRGTLAVVDSVHKYLPPSTGGGGSAKSPAVGGGGSAPCTSEVSGPGSSVAANLVSVTNVLGVANLAVGIYNGVQVTKMRYELKDLSTSVRDMGDQVTAQVAEVGASVTEVGASVAGVGQTADRNNLLLKMANDKFDLAQKCLEQSFSRLELKQSSMQQTLEKMIVGMAHLVEEDRIERYEKTYNAMIEKVCSPESRNGIESATFDAFQIEKPTISFKKRLDPSDSSLVAPSALWAVATAKYFRAEIWGRLRRLTVDNYPNKEIDLNVLKELWSKDRSTASRESMPEILSLIGQAVLNPGVSSSTGDDGGSPTDPLTLRMVIIFAAQNLLMCHPKVNLEKLEEAVKAEDLAYLERAECEATNEVMPIVMAEYWALYRGNPENVDHIHRLVALCSPLELLFMVLNDSDKDWVSREDGGLNALCQFGLIESADDANHLMIHLLDPEKQPFRCSRFQPIVNGGQPITGGGQSDTGPNSIMLAYDFGFEHLAIPTQDWLGNQVLRCIQQGGENDLDILIRLGFNLQCSIDGQSLLAHARSIKNDKICEMLEQAGAYEKGDLYRSVESKKPFERVLSIIQHGADCNEVGELGTALMLSCQMGDPRMTQFLLSRGAHTQVDIKGAPLEYEVRNELLSIARGNPELTKLLKSAGAHESGDVYNATRDNDIDRLIAILHRGADANEHGRSPQGAHQSALELAINDKKFEIVDVLLAFGADVNHRDEHGQTLLARIRSREDSSSDIIKVLENAVALQ